MCILWSTSKADYAKMLHNPQKYLQCCGSGIRCIFDPWIREPEWVKNQDPDPG